MGKKKNEGGGLGCVIAFVIVGTFGLIWINLIHSVYTGEFPIFALYIFSLCKCIYSIIHNIHYSNRSLYTNPFMQNLVFSWALIMIIGRIIMSRYSYGAFYGHGLYSTVKYYGRIPVIYQLLFDNFGYTGFLYIMSENRYGLPLLYKIILLILQTIKVLYSLFAWKVLYKVIKNRKKEKLL